jgi:cytidylate kinase
MYRAVALAAMQKNLDWNDSPGLARLARQITIELREGRVFLDGIDVTSEIRTSTVTGVTHYAANNPQVREHLVTLQRQFASGKNIVTEGRDQGTVVFPHAACKIFLTASPEERAKRRQRDMQARGESTSLEEVLHLQNQRDRSDSTRSTGPLIPATDAIHFCTDGLAEADVIEQLEAIVRQSEKPK